MKLSRKSDVSYNVSHNMNVELPSQIPLTDLNEAGKFNRSNDNSNMLIYNRIMKAGSTTMLSYIGSVQGFNRFTMKHSSE